MSEELKRAAYQQALNALAYEALQLGVDADALRQRVAVALLQADTNAAAGQQTSPAVATQAIELASAAITFAQKDGGMPQ